MVIAKCVECGKEYELQEDENPADFQCECGGNLIYHDNVFNANSEVKKDIKDSKISPKDGSKENPMDRFNKLSGGVKAVMGLGICCIGVILIIGLGGMISDITTSYNTYSSSTMSFQYPSDWNVYQQSSRMVVMNKGAGADYRELSVEIMGNSVSAETDTIVSEGYYYDDKSVSGTPYREFNQKKDITVTVLLAQKNGKVFEITGDPLDTGVMEKIVGTIN